jgi:sugar lactone lactonase YvrE
MLGFVRRHPLATGGLVVGAAVAAIASADSSLDPVAWDPPKRPTMTGALAPNDSLTGAGTVVEVEGPEDAAFDEEGRLYTGGADGTVYRTVEPVGPDDTGLAVEPFAEPGGRPLGLAFDGDDLLVCAESAGLVSISPDGSVKTLAERAGGRPIAYADDLHVTDDAVYVTDATVHDLFQHELFELRDTGRLLAYRDGEVSVELEGLGFANGVVPGPDGESLLVTETSRYRVTRYYHRGDRAGESEPFATNLPGYPDNIDRVANGEGYWVAVPAPRDATLDGLHQYPWLVRQLGKLPDRVLAGVDGDDYGLLLRLNEEGAVVDSHHDPTGGVFGVTSATPHEGALYLGSLWNDRLVRVRPGWQYPPTAPEND